MILDSFRIEPGDCVMTHDEELGFVGYLVLVVSPFFGARLAEWYKKWRG